MFLQQLLTDPSFTTIIIIVLIVLILGLAVNYLQKRRVIDELNDKNELIRKQAEVIAKKNKLLESQNWELKELNDEKNNIIGIVSHDLKAPLNRLFALSNLIYISSDNLTQEQKEYLEKMNQVIKEGLDLIRNLLDIRAIEYKGIKLNKEWIDLRGLISKLVKSYDSSAQKKNLTINVEVDEDFPRIRSDKQYLNRIFDNLLSNAIKFSPPQKEVKIRLQKKDEKLVISVIDEGPGISTKEKQKLFHKFQILSTKPTAGESSTGLGLSIVKSLVDLLEGNVYCESELEKGSSFIVELPYKKDQRSESK